MAHRRIGESILRTAIVKLSDRVGVEWLHSKSIEEAQPGDLSVSRIGTLTAAIVTPPSGDPFIVASMYGLWEERHLRA